MPSLLDRAEANLRYGALSGALFEIGRGYGGTKGGPTEWTRLGVIVWGEIAAAMLPRRYFWLITPNNMTRGLPINQDVVDSTPTQAISVCAAGSFVYAVSPAFTMMIWRSPNG